MFELIAMNTEAFSTDKFCVALFALKFLFVNDVLIFLGKSLLDITNYNTYSLKTPIIKLPKICNSVASAAFSSSSLCFLAFFLSLQSFACSCKQQENVDAQ